MNIKNRLRGVWSRLRRKKCDAEVSAEEVAREEIFPEGKRATISKSPNKRSVEISAAEVAREEIFPEGKRTSSKPACAKKPCAKKPCESKSGSAKPPSKRTRPANPEYTMIDPDDESFDASKS